MWYKLLSWIQSLQANPPKPSQVLVLPPTASFTKDITHAHIYLQERWPQLKDQFETQYPNYELRLLYVWRSTEYQARLYKQGRQGIVGEHIVTNADGVTNLSQHNYWPSRAFDVMIFDKISKKIIWDDQVYAYLTPIAQQLGLVHGIVWKNFPDAPHMELPKDIK